MCKTKKSQLIKDKYIYIYNRISKITIYIHIYIVKQQRISVVIQFEEIMTQAGPQN